MDIQVFQQCLGFLVIFQAQSSLNPFLIAKAAGQLIGSLHGGFGQIQGLPQKNNIFRLDFIIADAHHGIGADLAPAGAFFIQGKDGHLLREKLFQGFDLIAGLAAAFPAIFVVHIKDQVDGGALLQHADQQHAGEEGLAGAALAENAVGALDELRQVQANFGLHIQRSADEEFLLIFPAEDQLDIPLRRHFDGGEMAGHGLDRLRSVQSAQRHLRRWSASAKHAACRRCWCRIGLRPKRVGGIRRA